MLPRLSTSATDGSELVKNILLLFPYQPSGSDDTSVLVGVFALNVVLVELPAEPHECVILALIRLYIQSDGD